MDKHISTTSKCLGFIRGIVSGVSFTLSITFFKMVRNLSIPEVILIRGVVEVFLILPYIVVLQPDVRGTQGSRLLLWTGSVIDTATIALELFAISTIPFGDAIAILFCSPVIDMLLNCYIHEEIYEIYRILIVVLLLIGISLITKPAGLIKLFNYLNITDQNGILEDGKQLGLATFGYIAAFSATTSLSCCALARKKSNNTTHFSVIIFSCAICNILASIIAILLMSAYTILGNWTDLIYVLLVSFLGMVSAIFHMLSLQRLSESFVSVVQSLEIVMAYMVQTFWFEETIDTSSLMGATSVMLSVFLITHEENMMSLIDSCGMGSEKLEILSLLNGQDDE